MPHTALSRCLSATLVLTLVATSLLVAPPEPSAVAAADPPVAARGYVSETADRVPGQIVVKLAAGALEGPSLRAAHGLTQVKSVPSLGVEVWQAPVGQEIAKIRQLQTDRRIVFAEPNYRGRARNHVLPTDPLYATNQDNLRLINMPDAWHATQGSASVISAVIDTGADFAHPDLAGRLASLTIGGTPGADHVFLSDPTPGCTIPSTPEDDAFVGADGFSHGTMVAGIMVANWSAVGIAGIAPQTRVAPIKVLDCVGSGTDLDVASAITFAGLNGAKVINISLGFDVPTCPALLQSAIDGAFNAGAVIVGAVANGYSSERTAPENCTNVIGVGSVNNHDQKADFSNFNDTVDIVAPGVEITSTFRNSAGAHTYLSASGNSFAAPHVAACAALVRSIAPALTAAQVSSVLATSAFDLGIPGRDDFFGQGRLNCGRAVQSAAAQPTATPVPATPIAGTPCGLYSNAQPTGAAVRASSSVPSGRQQRTAGRSLGMLPYAGPSTAAQPAALGPWSQIACETFEGNWPSANWEVFDNDAVTGGDQCWNDVAFQGYQSAKSAWTAGGCANGITPGAATNYPARQDSWMIYGPFNLADAADAELRFQVWYDIAQDGDYLFWGAGPDAFNFGGFSLDGKSTLALPPTNQGWVDISLDLKNAPDPADPGNATANYLGNPSVYVAFVFLSGATGSGRGAYVDNVHLHKRVGVPSTPVPTATPTTGGTGFGLERTASGVRMTWSPGTVQTGYIIIRWSPPNEFAFLPRSLTPLSATTVTYTDTESLPNETYCYLLMQVSGTPPSINNFVGFSDFFCLYPNRASGVAPPTNVLVQLYQGSVANLSWTAPGGQTSYELTSITFNGAQPQTRTLAGNVTSTTFDTGGNSTCFVLRAKNGVNTIGTATDVCAVPGISTLGAAGRAGAVERALDQLRGGLR